MSSLNRERAALYEDEKRRIITSCFSKKEDGVAVESYITHVRVIEDAAHPSIPPPPDSAASNKKSRVILVSVKKNGRVRVHKARENPTGTFSIGKTWNMEELSSIQSYTNLIPRNDQDEAHKQWANGVGFIITLGKPYYWQAPTSKEKDFFIGSIVKIYRKYTSRLPELYGFGAQEIEHLTGAQATPNPQIQTPPLRPQVKSPILPYPLSSEQSDEQRPPARDVHRPPPIEPLRAPIDKPKTSEVRPTPAPVSIYEIPPERPRTSDRPRTSETRPTPPPVSTVPARPTPPPIAAVPTPLVTVPTPTVTAPTPINTAPVSIPKSGAASETNSQFTTPAATPSELNEVKIPEFPLISNDQPANTFTQTQKEIPKMEKSIIVEQPAKIDTPKADLMTEPQPGKESSTAIHTAVTSPEPATALSPRKTDEEHRPGLGPMVKKKSAKDIAGQFRKAAMAAGAFQPRQGGAGARLKALQDKEKGSGEPDGVTSVVPAPLLRGMSNDTIKSSVPPTPTTTTSPPNALAIPQQTSPPPTNNVVSKPQIQQSAEGNNVAPSETLPTVPTPSKLEEKANHTRSPSPDKGPSYSPERRKQQQLEADIAKYCAPLGIDPQILNGRGAQAVKHMEILKEFGWDGKFADGLSPDEFKANIDRELNRVQTTGWLQQIEQAEVKREDLLNKVDDCIRELEIFDDMLTLCAHELDTVRPDIEFIEAQSQGLQVYAANQKLLQNELRGLLDVLTIPHKNLNIIQNESIEHETGIQNVERSLVLLHKALLMIEPNLRSNTVTVNDTARGGANAYADIELKQMKAVQEQKAVYDKVIQSFAARLIDTIIRSMKSIDIETLDVDRQRMYMYQAMMLFLREADLPSWQDGLVVYETNLKGKYQSSFREYAMSQRRMVRKAGGDNPGSGVPPEALFTTREKEKPDENLASTAARKLTVRRGKTVKAGALRNAIGEKSIGKLDACEIFSVVLKHQADVISEEQNFVACFFNLHSQLTENDFAEAVASAPPSQRKVPNLKAKQYYDPDRTFAKYVRNAVGGIFSSWQGDLQSLLDWCVAMDPLQSVGVILAIEQCSEAHTNQEYISNILRKMHELAVAVLHKFVDEQVKAIEETKVKISKRKGVISFMRTFPLFSTLIEQMVPAESDLGQRLEIRSIINSIYQRILKAMWESLNFIAKDNTTTGGSAYPTAAGNEDPEDKEALNYHILLIENMHHYLEDVDALQNSALNEWANKAKQDLSTHLAQYTNSVIRRPLGKWLDFVESTEAMLNSEVSGVAGRTSHSKSAAKKVLSSYDSKEIKKGIDILKKRIEKHFSSDTEDSSANLVSLVLEECNACYVGAYDRMKDIIDKVYEGSLEIEWTKDDATSLFLKR